MDEPTAKERTRTRATMLPGALFAFEVADLKEIATLPVTPTATLLGTAPGFHFSSRD